MNMGGTFREVVAYTKEREKNRIECARKRL